MQREIKFRGKRIDNSEWVYGFYTKIAVNFGQNDVIMEQTKGGSFVPQFIDIKTLGQFIGILDKNGTEIYEDDVVSNGVFVTVVEYCDGWYFPFGNSDTCLYSDEVEVIGNIHDNPELLEGDNG